MIRNYLRIGLIIIIAANICGCAELRKKFTRKKKSQKEDFSFYRPEKYKAKPPDERYQEHYVLWYNWQLDLERTDGVSHLRDMRALNESLRHLTAMRDLLQEEQAEKLDIQVKHIEKIRTRLKKTRVKLMKDTRNRKLAERTGRIVVNDFSYNRMKNYIKKEDPEVPDEESEKE